MVKYRHWHEMCLGQFFKTLTEVLKRILGLMIFLFQLCQSIINKITIAREEIQTWNCWI